MKIKAISHFTQPLTQLLEQEQSSHRPEDDKLHLVITKKMTADELNQLLVFYKAHVPHLFFSRLSLQVDNELINNDHFLQLMTELKSSQLVGLDLCFAEQELNQDSDNICHTLTKKVAPIATFPIVINQITSRDIYTTRYQSPKLAEFQKTIIDNIHHRTISNQTNAKPIHTFQPDKNPKFNKPNQLKKLINKTNTKDSHDFDHHVPIQIQHIEQQIIQQEVRVEVEEDVDVSTQQQYQQLEAYQGKLINYAEFENIPNTLDVDLRKKIYTTLHNECFANLPHAIKYLTTAAANELTQHIGSYVSFNTNNLPNGFTLKQTEKSEMVLDFDEFAEHKETNQFTPIVFTINYSEQKPIYDISNDVINISVKNETLKTKLNQLKSHMTNLWIRFGDEGVKRFTAALDKIEGRLPGFAHTLIDCYLIKFPHWDHFLDNDNFFKALNIIAYYEPSKLGCLTRFLVNTGTSQHDLFKTVMAFDIFWVNALRLCKKHDTDVSKLNCEWTTPVGGQPVVYMERLLCILQNARNLDEQLTNLSGLDLSNYGAYYASRFEQFKIVSKEMNFDYQYAHQDQLPFNPMYRPYSIDIQFLYDTLHPTQLRECDQNAYLINTNKEQMTSEEFAELQKQGYVSEKYDISLFKPPFRMFTFDAKKNQYELVLKALSVKRTDYLPYLIRFLAQQVHGILLHDFVGVYKTNQLINDNYFKYNGRDILFSIILLVSHERYNNKIPLDDLVKCIYYMNNHSVLNQVNPYMLKLYNMDIKLGDYDGGQLYNVFQGMNSHEHESHGHSKSDTINKIFAELIKNKYALYKLLERRPFDTFWPLVYAIDTANYLMQDKVLETTFKDELLLFADIISSDKNEVYYEYLPVTDDSIDKEVKDLPHEWKESRRKHLKEENEARLVMLEQAKNKINQIKQYLLQAATLPQPNNLNYCFMFLLKSDAHLNYDSCLDLFSHVTNLGSSFDKNKVGQILSASNIHLRKGISQLEFDFQEIKKLKWYLVKIIIAIEYALQRQSSVQSYLYALLHLDQVVNQSQSRYEELIQRNSIAIDELLAKKWYELTGRKIPVSNDFGIDEYIVKESNINLLFSFYDLDHKPLVNIDKDSTQWNEAEFQGFLNKIAIQVKKLVCYDAWMGKRFGNKMGAVLNEIAKIAENMLQLVHNYHLYANKDRFLAAFEKIVSLQPDHNFLYSLTSLFARMRMRNSTNLLESVVRILEKINENDKYKLIDVISYLDVKALPTEYIEALIKIVKPSQYDDYERVFAIIIKAYSQDPNNPILRFFLTKSDLSLEKMNTIITFIVDTKIDKQHLADFLFYIKTTTHIDRFLSHMDNLDNTRRELIMEIMVESHVPNSSISPRLSIAEYDELVRCLKDKLSTENLIQLFEFIKISPISASCLLHALKTHQPTTDFNQFLTELEKSPFGKRPESEYLDCSQVERVVNPLFDMLSDQPYSYEDKNKIMDSFLFVNQAHYLLPIYHGKPANELSNRELKEIFLSIKQGQLNHLSNFERRLYALPLIRVAMLRGTGQFAYSTQMIAIIIAMLYGKNISNILAGQGKSLIDYMKAALLWLDNDRVDSTTLSTFDVERDIANLSSCFRLLGIPYASSPITASSDCEDFQSNGLNFSTPYDLQLFKNKATYLNYKFQKPTDKVALILGESDYSLLDDRTIYRYATDNVIGMNKNHEWIYYAINEFVTSPAFKDVNATEADDIAALRHHLITKGKEINHSVKIIHHISDEQLSTWINSAILVNYYLKLNYKYVIPEGYETKYIKKIPYQTRTIKLLMPGGKVSNNAQFGEGAQQLLCAKLNVELKTNDFVIESESLTLISTNIKNFIDDYHAEIWGASGTVGSQAEIKELAEKYGFTFSKIEPHQEQRLIFHPFDFAVNENEQFSLLLKRLSSSKRDENSPPDLIFCKDIETAKRLLKSAKNQFNGQIQLFTGVGNEEEVIRNAGKPGMVTITTSALSRNTDIHYNREIGLNIWHTCPDSTRQTEQKSLRSGRQGSNGQVYFLFNLEEIPDKDLAAFRKAIEVQYHAERNAHEELYNVMGYLLNHLFTNLPYQANRAEILKLKWATFSKECERRYQNAHIHHEYKEMTFIAETVKQYNKLLADCMHNAPVVDIDDLLRQIHNKCVTETTKRNNARNVEMNAPIALLLAYRYVRFDQSSTKLNVGLVPLLKNEMISLLSTINLNNFIENNIEFLNMLLRSKVNQATMSAAYSDFINEFLRKKISVKKTFSLGMFNLEQEMTLDDIMKNKYYLTMFNTFSTTFAPVALDLTLIKNIVLSQLDQSYTRLMKGDEIELLNSLKHQLSHTTNITAVCTLLTDVVNKFDGLTQQHQHTAFFGQYIPYSMSGLGDTLRRVQTFITGLTGIRAQSQLNQSASANDQQIDSQQVYLQFSL